MTGEAHDTLRDDLADALFVIIQEAHGAKANPGKSRQQARIAADAELPVVLRYADAERERIAAAIGDRMLWRQPRPSTEFLAGLDTARRIARGQP